MSKKTIALPKEKGPAYQAVLKNILDLAPRRHRNKQLDDCEIYWNKHVNLYYIKPDVTGRRKANALVYCPAYSDWRVSTRFGAELDDPEFFMCLGDMRKELSCS